MRFLLLFLSICFTQAISAQNTKYVTSETGLNMRTQPDKKSGKILRIPYGEAVKMSDNKTYKTETLEGKKGNWKKVVYNKKTGFVFDIFLSDSNPKEAKNATATTPTKANNSPTAPANTPSTPTSVVGKHEAKMAAFLIYDDNSYSSFDLINDKDVYLWNTIIGEGSAEKASNKTFLRVQASSSLLDIPITIEVRDLKLKKVIYTKEHKGQKDPIDITLNETGCGELQIQVKYQKTVLAKHNIDFKCGN